MGFFSFVRRTVRRVTRKKVPQRGAPVIKPSEKKAVPSGKVVSAPTPSAVVPTRRVSGGRTETVSVRSSQVSKTSPVTKLAVSTKEPTTLEKNIAFSKLSPYFSTTKATRSFFRAKTNRNG